MADGSPLPEEMLTERGSYRGDPASPDWPRIVEEAWMVRPSRPAPVYDPSQFFSSGEMRDTTPRVGRAWSLTFDTPGAFHYFCVPHVNLGQIGQITVVPRES